MFKVLISAFYISEVNKVITRNSGERSSKN